MVELAIYLIGMMFAIAILLGLIGLIGEVFVLGILATASSFAKIWKSLRRTPQKIDNR